MDVGSGGVVCSLKTGGDVSKLEGDRPEGVLLFSGCRQAGLSHTLRPRVQYRSHRVLVRQLQ